jgi:hypothetical protein
LKQRFDTGKRDLEWVSHFQRLFNLRDAAVHAKVKPLPAVPHPSGVSNAGQVNADYSAEVAVVGPAPDGAVHCREPVQRFQGIARRFEVANDVEIGAVVDQGASTG